MAVARTPEQYRLQLRGLLPSGPAWDPELVPEIELVLAGVAVEFSRLEARAVDLLNEMDPAGVSYWGERFGANPGNALECLIRRPAPAHTVVHINYD